VPFSYRDHGSVATIGRKAAIALIGGIRLWGLPAWLMWLFLHIYFLVGFRNRLVVIVDWALAFWAFRRNARVVTGLDATRTSGADASAGTAGVSNAMVPRRAETVTQ
jgi:NADH:ubiquinone reductase (H+-translocating)